MAILTPSALIESITGRMKGDVLQLWRGINYIRSGPSPRQPRVRLQQNIRGLISTYAGKWSALSAGQRTAWDYYATGLVAEQTGFNAYCSNNARLLYAAYSTLVEIEDAPAWPTAPNAPSGFTLTYNAGGDVWNAAWTQPSSPVLYVQCFQSPQAGYDDKLFPTWTFVETKSSLFSPIAIDASPFGSGTVMRARLRALDEEGEVSSFTATLESTKT